jgi:hypothetical protein
MLVKGGIEYEMGDFASAEETMAAAIGLQSVKRRVTDTNTLNFKVLTFS